MAENRKKSYGISLARVFCAFAIVAYHYATHVTTDINKIKFLNGDLGAAVVDIFFFISGYVIYMTYPKIESVKNFYYRRFIKLMPMFWLAFLAAYIDTSLTAQSLTWGGNPLTLIFTLLGMDGLMYGYTPDYYILGEWFLGAIIICYLVYPLLLKAFDKLKIWLPVILIVLCIPVLRMPVLNNHGHQNVLACITLFTLGMLLSRYQLLDNLYFKIGAIIAAAVTLFVKFPCNRIVPEALLGMGVLCVLYMLGNQICKWEPVRKTVGFLDSITYPVYLLHHLIILRYIYAIHPQGMPQHLLVFICSTLIIIVLANVLRIFTNHVIAFFQGKRIGKQKAQTEMVGKADPLEANGKASHE